MIYLDNAATARPLEEATAYAGRFLSELYFNPSALYGGGVAVRKAMNEAREFLHSCIADEKYELIFTSGGTESDNHAVFCGGKRGNVVTTQGEHAAVFQSCRSLKTRGVEPRFAPLHADGSVDEEGLLSLVDERTSLVSVVHVNNETGAVNDIARLSRLVKEKNSRTLFHSDGVQAFGKIHVRLSEGVDLYSVSAHKIGGVKGTGALYKRKSVALAPYLYGGGQENDLRSGTENVFGIMAFYSAAKKRFAALENEAERVRAVRERIFSTLDGTLFTRLSPADGSPYILSVSAEGLRGEVLQRMLEEEGVVVGTGSACSSKHPFSRVMQACGHGDRVLRGVLRLSLSPETTETDGVRAAQKMNETAQRFKEKTIL